MYNFVSTHLINQCFKKSNYFKMNLGKALSVAKDKKRKFKLNDDDTFIKFYLEKYRRVIYSEGNIGQINFFLDHSLNNNQILVFYKEKEFAFEHNPLLLKSKGINGYLGSFIEEIETKYKSEIENVPNIEINEQQGIAEKVINNPGAATYEDIKKYMEAKRKGKLKS